MKQLSFEDTSIAFEALSDKELRETYALFTMMNNNFMVNTGSKITNWALKFGLPVQGLIKKTIFPQFCGGETIEESKAVVNKLKKYNVHAILDYGIEAKQNEEDFEKTAQYLVKTINYAIEEPHLNIISSKITGLIRFELLQKYSSAEKLNKKEKEEYDRGLKRVKFVCKAAYDAKVQIYFDAEESWIQPAIDEIVMEMIALYNCDEPIIFQTVQLYRHDRLQYLKDELKKSLDECYILAVKLVRGAYMERERARAEEMGYEDPIQPNKAATDRDFNLALDFCMEHLGKMAVCCASHNEESTKHLAQLIDDGHLENNHPLICFAQLYGMSDHMTFNLAKAGFYAAKYLPYGPVNEVIPYLIRRANENSSVDGQMSREFKLVKKEMKRRELI